MPPPHTPSLTFVHKRIGEGANTPFPCPSGPSLDSKWKHLRHTNSYNNKKHRRHDWHTTAREREAVLDFNFQIKLHLLLCLGDRTLYFVIKQNGTRYENYILRYITVKIRSYFGHPNILPEYQYFQSSRGRGRGY